jgi:P63C domain
MEFFMDDSKSKTKGRAVGGRAKNALMTPDERKAQSEKMLAAKKERAAIAPITHTGELKLIDVVLQCYVSSTGERILSGRGLQEALRLVDEEAPASGTKPGSRVDRFLTAKWSQPFMYKDRDPDHFLPIKRVYQGKSISGYRAEVLADVCDAMLEARDAGLLTTPRRRAIAKQCEILMRGFMRVGIVALVDEATGYQRDRSKDALAKILEAFVAKEIQPYLKTFPADFYEQLFRLYDLPYPPVGNKSWRPAFFGHITNDVVYSRLAPELLPELKKAASRAEKKARLHQWLTAELGHPRLREHLSSIVSILKLSKTPDDFKSNVNLVHPRYGDTKPLDFGSPI